MVSTWQKADGQRLAGPEPAGVWVRGTSSQSCDKISSGKLMWCCRDTIDTLVFSWNLGGWACGSVDTTWSIAGFRRPKVIRHQKNPDIDLMILGLKVIRLHFLFHLLTFKWPPAPLLTIISIWLFRVEKSIRYNFPYFFHLFL